MCRLRRISILNSEAPWLKYYGTMPHTLTYPDCSMVDMIEQIAKKYPDQCAYSFMGERVDYRTMAAQIHQCARALAASGIRRGDKVTICMPNTPHAILLFYALNRIGAIPNMVHPLSSEGEIVFFVNESESVALLTLEQFYPKIRAIRDRIHLDLVIVASIKDYLSPVKRVGYALTVGRKIAPVPETPGVVSWQTFLKRGEGYTGEYLCSLKGADPAAILYSGGTTGTTKGILLSNLNFNALALQTQAASGGIDRGDVMLAIMPIFHGFGLGVCIHTVLAYGCECVLVPQFTVDSVSKLLKKHRPQFIAGVPTLFEALLRNKHMQDIDLSCLKGVFSGGDSLSVELKRKVDAFLKQHGATIQVREGYGTTECVTASCLTPKDFYKEGSIGIPFPDTFYKIVTPATQDEVPYGEVGEICISGPTVMQEYIHQPRETAQTLQQHDDGRIWLHTGDLGSMDEDGFIYFKQRLKRMIVTSGYNVYPSQIENIIDAHDAVLLSTVIGVKDDYKMQKVKAFVVLKPGVEPTEAVRQSIFLHCRKNIAKYAMPYEIEFRDSLPKTLVGKVAYTVLEKEEAEKAGVQKQTG